MNGGDRTASLVMMANQIATFFASQPGQAAGLHTADHIIAFWTPAMRGRLVTYADAGGADLNPTAREAATVIKTRSAKSVEHALEALGAPSPAHRPGDDAG